MGRLRDRWRGRFLHKILSTLGVGSDARRAHASDPGVAPGLRRAGGTEHGERDGRASSANGRGSVVSSFSRLRALELAREGQAHHHEGDLKRAMELYVRSIAICPTAEAHTLLGWAYSSRNRHFDAIVECRKAIALDPQYGNAYNDIGSYLIQLDQLDDAVPWLERAKKTRTCENPHYPYMNLGRVFAARGMLIRALREFEGALKVRPGEPHCEAAVEQLRRALRQAPTGVPAGS